MTTLHLGVIEQPYSDSSYGAGSKNRRVGQAKRGKANAPKAAASNQQTTGSVAEILEAKYHIIETFYELHEDEIIDKLTESIHNALQNLSTGAPGSIGITAEAESIIEEKFRDWLSQRGMDATSTEGVPTAAAQKGVSHRFLHPYARRPSRPSFIDTGLYEANFKAWTDQT